jgi:hypothetical protein
MGDGRSLAGDWCSGDAKLFFFFFFPSAPPMMNFAAKSLFFDGDR